MTAAWRSPGEAVRCLSLQGTDPNRNDRVCRSVSWDSTQETGLALSRLVDQPRT
ncbi:MAG: hypothetical protein NXI02_17560 [Rhodobacteraceae bacterium]|nr:hypothetical protein [Paracoccaceae bacterium]